MACAKIIEYRFSYLQTQGFADMSRIREIKELLLLIVLGGMIGFTTNAVAQEDLQVVTSIKPLHSIVSAVMDGVGEPRLIIPGFQVIQCIDRGQHPM